MKKLSVVAATSLASLLVVPCFYLILKREPVRSHGTASRTYGAYATAAGGTPGMAKLLQIFLCVMRKGITSAPLRRPSR